MLRFDGFERTECTGLYHDPKLRNAIHALKYRGCTAIRPAMVGYLRRRVLHTSPNPLLAKEGVTMVIQPLPADPARVRERGFDHAAFLAECLAEALGVAQPIADFLERRPGHGIAQAMLEDPALRSANVRDIFCLKSGVSIPPSILLVDDVITTGATMKEAAAVLRAAGVYNISAFALAMGK